MSHDKAYLENIDNLELMAAVCRNEVADVLRSNPYPSEQYILQAAHTHLEHAATLIKRAYELRQEKEIHTRTGGIPPLPPANNETAGSQTTEDIED